jgi:hypothetical protein
MLLADHAIRWVKADEVFLSCISLTNNTIHGSPARNTTQCQIHASAETQLALFHLQKSFFEDPTTIANKIL